MKLSRKFALGVSAVLLAAAIGFVSCGTEDDDDEAGAISGKGSKYTVAYKNTTDTEYRAYKTTALKHYAALTKISLDVHNTEAENKDGVMGVIWNLQKSSEVNVKNNAKAKDFFIAGCDYKNDSLRVYISKFENVTNMQDENFGAPYSGHENIGGDNPAEETEYLKWTSLDVQKDENGKVEFYVDVFLIDGEKNKLTTTSDFKSKTTGYGIALYKTYDAKTKTLSDQIGGTKYIEGVYTVENEKSSITQQTNAVYAMVSPKQQLNGTWEYVTSYGAAEVVED
jgi:hypothetical protein